RVERLPILALLEHVTEPSRCRGLCDGRRGYSAFTRCEPPVTLRRTHNESLRINHRTAPPFVSLRGTRLRVPKTGLPDSRGRCHRTRTAAALRTSSRIWSSRRRAGQSERPVPAHEQRPHR